MLILIRRKTTAKTPRATNSDELREILSHHPSQVFVVGPLQTGKPVGFPELNEKCINISKRMELLVRQAPEKHGLVMHPEWEIIGTEANHVKEISLFSLELPYEYVKFPEAPILTIVEDSDFSRNEYYGIPVGTKVALHISLKYGVIQKGAKLWLNTDVDELVREEMHWQLLMAAFKWIAVTATTFAFMGAFAFILR